MNYLSVCSGIEAASVAWEPLGFRAVGFSEIEKFPCQVLAHRYPTVRNYGDMTKYKEWKLNEPVDVLVGGTPCQSFSVAGLRKGLEDPRGNLMLTYLGIADRYRPKWIVWENVPGVLSSNGGRDFGAFIGALVELGYGFAYRVLDAQWFGVAQRRRRVFVVGCLGDATSAAAVLFESESVSRNPAPSREKGEGLATNVAPSLTASNNPSRSPQSSEVTQPMAFEENFDAIRETQIAPAMTAKGYGVSQNAGGLGIRQATVRSFYPSTSFAFSQNATDRPAVAFQASGDRKNPSISVCHETAFCLPANPMSDRGQAVAFAQNTRDEVRLVGGDGQITGALSASSGMKQTNYIAFEPGIAAREGNPSRFSTLAPTLRSNAGDNQPAIAFTAAEVRRSGTIRGAESVPTLTSQAKGGDTEPCVSYGSQVRRLTPMECERLQGFPDGWTDIRTGGKPTPDGPRYKAIGNSMAVPVMRWIGERIHAEEKNQK